MMQLHPNLVTNARAVSKLNLLLIITLTYDTYMYIFNHILTQTENTSPCSNEKLNV